MTTAFYRTGTVAVTQNSKVVTGTGTNWTTGPTKPLAGDVFIFNNKMYEIDSVVSDTEIRLYRNFEDSTASSKSYAIMRNASLNISARIAAQVAQVVNQKQIMVDEFHDFLTNNTDSTVPLTDTLGNVINVTPIPMLDKDYIEKIGGIDSAVNQAIQDINDAFDNFEYPVLTAVQRQAIVDANEEEYAASGIVHMGKHKSSTSNTGIINEGLTAFWGHENYANKLTLGAPLWTGSHDGGTSKTEFAVSHIAGVVSTLRAISDAASSSSSSFIVLPPAPGGYDVFDSTGDARGTGKADLNLLTEVDPKYGDSAEDLYGVGTAAAKNEACSRAFEGSVKYGDGRDGGTDGKSRYNQASTLSNEDGVIWSRGANGWNGIDFVDAVANTGYGDLELEFTYHDETGTEIPLYFLGTAHRVSNGQTVKITVPNITTGSSLVMYVKTTRDIGFSNVSLKPVTEEVVTDRVDMFGLEQFDMVMKDGEIFDMIQSPSNTFGDTGVPTVTSVRPDSFFAVYEGQENIVKGKCVRWPDLNRAQKRHIAKYMKERLWVNEDGDLTFTSIRQRSFAGLGNGDWDNIDSTHKGNSFDQFLSFGKNMMAVEPQGTLDTATSFTDSSSKAYATYPLQMSNNDKQYLGAFALWNNKTYAYKGNCFFYVLGTVSRLNQGAFVEGVNGSGARCCRDTNDGGGFADWQVLDKPITDKKTCFMIKGNDSPSGDSGAYGASGSVATGRSGRPDGRYYDGIYADGLGGVVDYRLPAYESGSPEEASKVWEKVKRRTYRGLEKLAYTFVDRTTQTASSNTNGVEVTGDISRYKVGDKLSLVVDGETNVAYSAKILSIDSVNSIIRLVGAYTRVASIYYIVNETETNLSVSGQFTKTSVIGDPANIFQIAALKGGWFGYWVSVINTGQGLRFPLNRKRIDLGNLPQIYTPDLGDSWVSFSRPFDGVGNEIPATALGEGNVYISTYQAFAKQTKPSTNKPVLNGEAGVGGVTQLARADYSQVMESLIGKVGVSSTSKDVGTLRLNSLTLDHSNNSSSSWGRLAIVAAYAPRHTPVDLSVPSNNSPAVKALPYQISNDGQCSLGIQANELTYDASPTVVNVTSANLNENLVAGSLYRVDRKAGSSVMDGGLYYCTTPLSSLGWDSSQWYIAENGEVKRFDNNVTYLVPATLGWNDDGTMKITASGSDTFVDRGGNTNLSVVHELALPYGWTKNRARAGEQIEGVDL